MKHICTLICMFFFSITCNSQDFKRSNTWVLGSFPVVKFNFNNNLAIDTVINTNPSSTPYCLVKSSSSCVSDSSGDLLFFSVGFLIYDKDGFLMDNGLYTNCPYGNVLANYYGASVFDQTSIIIPKKGNQYYVFSTGMSDSVANNYLNHVYTEFDVLNYSVVDMDSNNGKGKVIQKNVVLADKQHYYNTALQAVKHANGKDWWLIKADCSNNRYQEYLVKEDTILGPFYQYYTDTSSYCYWIGQLYFNQEGTQMACSNKGDRYYNNGVVGYIPTRVDIFDFNRCNGELVHKKKFIVPYDTSTYTGNDFKMGISFSPNGKLLYVSNTYTIHQIDLEDTNTNNAIFIHGPDTSDISYFAWYHNMATAPDGKLYIGNFHGTRKYMSYIDKPNVKGLGCNFMPQGLWQPYTNLKSPPNMPNYGLGADTSKTCWPLSINQLSIQHEALDVYPNPSGTVFYIKNKQGKKKELFTMLGELLFTTTKDEIDVSRYSKGVYYLRCEQTVRKVVVE